MHTKTVDKQLYVGPKCFGDGWMRAQLAKKDVLASTAGAYKHKGPAAAAMTVAAAAMTALRGQGCTVPYRMPARKQRAAMGASKVPAAKVGEMKPT